MSPPSAFQQAILEAAVQAPSGDNLQPWRFRWDGEQLVLLRDSGRDTSLYNVCDLATFVALGAAMENILIAASALGYEASPVCFPEGAASSTVAGISFAQGGRPDPLFDVIAKRCSNRKPYSTQPFGTQMVEALTAEVIRFPNVGIRWIHDSEQRKRLSKITAQGDRTLFENQLIHEHFFSCIRWNEEEVQRTRDGLPIATLELGRAGSALFRLLRNRSLVQILNCFGFSRIAANRSGGMIRKSSAIGLIAVPRISSETFLAAGRAFQRLWLTATAQRLSLQPMTGFVLLQLRLILSELAGLNEKEIKLLESTRQQLSELFHLESQVPAIMFRLGIAAPPSGRTVRRQAATS